jgi:succinoglycan biosynthesis transport protein ExoP
MSLSTNREIESREIGLRNTLINRGNIAARLPYFEDERYETETGEREDEIHLRAYLQRVVRHKWIVFIITLLFTSAAVIYLFYQPDVYTAHARVQVDAENNVGLSDAGKTVSPFDDRAYFNTQLELLESPGLILRVVKKLGLENNRDFMTGDAGTTNKWQSKFNEVTGLYDKTGQPVNQTTVKPVKEETKQTRSAKKGESLTPSENDSLMQVVKAVQEKIVVEPVLRARQNIKDTRLISISFHHRDPQISMLVSNALADELVVTNLKNKMRVNNNENDYLQNNIADLKAQIQRDEQKLLSFGRNYQLPSLDSSQNTVVERLVGLNRQLLEAENARKLAEAEYQSSQNQGVADALAESGDKQIGEIDSKLGDLRQRRAQLLVEATEKYPEVIEVDRQIAVLEKQAQDKRKHSTALFKTNAEAHYRQALYREESVRKAFERQRGETLGQNEAAINYRIVQQGLETNKNLLDEMSKREKENEMLKAKAPNNIRVIDYAALPTEPVDPKRAPFLGLVFLFSFTLGIGGALLKDYFDDSVHTTDEVEKTLSLPALAVIPQVGRGIINYRRRTADSAAGLRIIQNDEADATTRENEAELLFNADIQSPLAEAFRRLRTALLLSPSVGEVKKILVTSSQQAEGKTTTALNIATSLAQTGAKVLIIDADLRNPRLHKIFNAPVENGLSDIFGRKVEQDELFKKFIRQHNLLYVMTAGSTSINSAECLGSERMRDLLILLDPIFDYIVIDSPPVVNFVDSTILATLVDGVLFVVQGNRSSREMVRHSTKVLRTVGAKIIGVVLNKVSMPTKYYYG